jgi:hypothetical protein
MLQTEKSFITLGPGENIDKCDYKVYIYSKKDIKSCKFYNFFGEKSVNFLLVQKKYNQNMCNVNLQIFAALNPIM